MKKSLLLTLFISSTMLGFSAVPKSDLDHYIPMPVQKKYGLNLLTTAQKSELASWLKGVNFKPPQAMNSTLSLNISNGQFIQLDDGTVWEIDPSEMAISQGWLSPVQITVTKTDVETQYPYKLYNTATQNAVSAKRVTMSQINE
ncbi:MAG: hypothetical protein P0S95_04880 [Rhabdochlamydiaceae bacterium]|nr:hypothetical protein [Candidatus Amphrikana amoebophyrae]